MTSVDDLKRLFEDRFQLPAQRVEPLPQELGGSPRKLVRIAGARQTAIGVMYDVREENVAFIEFSKHFRRHHLPVPEIYAADLDRNVYLEEDLGNMTLYEFLSTDRKGQEVGPDVMDAYRKAVNLLPRFQVEAGRDLDYGVCYPRESFDGQSIRWDLNYFKYHFLKLAGIPFNEQGLEDDFERLTGFLLEADREYFLYRDFQSRNIMLRNGEPFFLDYQGGRKGALQYDIASLLFDAKADLAPAVRQDLLESYLDALSGFIRLDRKAFMRHYYAYVYVRVFQALGAYGYRGFYERKPLFLASVPYALKNLRWLLHNAELPIQVPTIVEAAKSMLASEKLRELNPGANGVRVRVFSFSFHKGLPPDEAGNGGGFVFDARNLPNPGRKERYRNLTGRDRAVAAYLGADEGVHQFLASARAMVEASINNYQRRGFRDLMVSFGCTGGQHRSVYLAEALSEHLRSRGIEVEVSHLGLEEADR